MINPDKVKSLQTPYKFDNTKPIKVFIAPYELTHAIYENTVVEEFGFSTEYCYDLLPEGLRGLEFVWAGSSDFEYIDPESSDKVSTYSYSNFDGFLISQGIYRYEEWVYQSNLHHQYDFFTDTCLLYEVTDNREETFLNFVRHYLQKHENSDDTFVYNGFFKFNECLNHNASSILERNSHIISKYSDYNYSLENSSIINGFLKQISEVTNLKFEQGNYDDSELIYNINYNFSSFVFDIPANGQVYRGEKIIKSFQGAYIGNYDNYPDPLQTGYQSRQEAAHEVVHPFLDHPGESSRIMVEYNEDPDSSREDMFNLYDSLFLVHPLYFKYHALTLMPYDIAALRDVYGVNDEAMEDYKVYEFQEYGLSEIYGSTVPEEFKAIYTFFNIGYNVIDASAVTSFNLKFNLEYNNELSKVGNQAFLLAYETTIDKIIVNKSCEVVFNPEFSTEVIIGDSAETVEFKGFDPSKHSYRCSNSFACHEEFVSVQGEDSLLIHVDS